MLNAELAINAELEKLKQEKISEAELKKVKNKTESMIAFEDMSLMNRANSLAYYELLGDAHLMNTELDRYNKVSVEDVRQLSNEIFTDENSSTLWYMSKN